MASCNSTLSQLPTRALIGRIRTSWMSLVDVHLALELRDQTVQDRNPTMTNVIAMISEELSEVLQELENRDVF